jgi:hypothetical protein
LIKEWLMTSEPASQTPDPTFGRDLDDEDHDLLTYNETAARIREEVALLEAGIARGGEGVDRLRERLQLIRATKARIARYQETDQNASGFLNYAGPGSTVE